MLQGRQAIAETGRALALLGLYILLLLAPLHQAAGLQRDLATLGYETAGAWSICAPLAEQGDGDTAPLIVKCPAQGLGTQLPASPAVFDMAWNGVVIPVAPPSTASPQISSFLIIGSSGPRAPPALA